MAAKAVKFEKMKIVIIEKVSGKAVEIKIIKH